MKLNNKKARAIILIVNQPYFYYNDSKYDFTVQAIRIKMLEFLSI